MLKNNIMSPISGCDTVRPLGIYTNYAIWCHMVIYITMITFW